MSVVVFIDRLEPADSSKRDAVLGLLGELAGSINADLGRSTGGRLKLLAGLSPLFRMNLCRFSARDRHDPRSGRHALRIRERVCSATLDSPRKQKVGTDDLSGSRLVRSNNR